MTVPRHNKQDKHGVHVLPVTCSTGNTNAFFKGKGLFNTESTSDPRHACSMQHVRAKLQMRCDKIIYRDEDACWFYFPRVVPRNVRRGD